MQSYNISIWCQNNIEINRLMKFLRQIEILCRRLEIFAILKHILKIICKTPHFKIPHLFALYVLTESKPQVIVFKILNLENSASLSFYWPPSLFLQIITHVRKLLSPAFEAIYIFFIMLFFSDIARLYYFIMQKYFKSLL